jgi:hypothetical protein
MYRRGCVSRVKKNVQVILPSRVRLYVSNQQFAHVEQQLAVVSVAGRRGCMRAWGQLGWMLVPWKKTYTRMSVRHEEKHSGTGDTMHHVYKNSSNIMCRGSRTWVRAWSSKGRPRDVGAWVRQLGFLSNFLILKNNNNYIYYLLGGNMSLNLRSTVIWSTWAKPKTLGHKRFVLALAN